MSRPTLAVTRWDELDAATRDTWLRGLRAPEPTANVAALVERVRREGDAAVLALTEELDGIGLERLAVPDEELESAEALIDPATASALRSARDAIRRFHADQRNLLRGERRVRTGPGVLAWRRWQPLELAGGYIPGGRASYPSSVLMLGVPAQLAGVAEMVIATPPRPDGSVDPLVLLAARLVGVRRVFRMGGAQAIAAMAYGTASVPRVDRIFGAGNAWVTAAKRMVASDTPIDLPAGPSECVVVADGSADPELVAADLLAQAEHGPDSLTVLVTTAPALLDDVEEQLPRLAAQLSTGERALVTLRAWGRAALVGDVPAAIGLAGRIAPEHLSLQVADAETYLDRVRNAGSVFVGSWSAVAAGDYATGTNHVLPTGAAARSYSGVGVEAFGRWMEVQRVTRAGVARVAPIVERIARAEGLPAHAASVALRAARAPEAGRADEGAPDDPVELLRRQEPLSGYVAEASDEELAARAGLSVERIARFDMNTLGGGALPAAHAAWQSYGADRALEYGDLSYARLRGLLGARHGVAPAQIIPGAGGDELIRLISQSTLGTGDAVVLGVPTFGMYEVEARLAGARVVEVPRERLSERQPVSALREAAEREAARLVWLCTPNNPTGDRYALDEIRRLAEGLPALVVADEAYLEFAEADSGEAPDAGSAIRLLDELPNVAVLRTLSKAYGLAGARVGYLVVAPGLAGRLELLRLPLPVAGPSDALATALLADEPAAAARRREIVTQRRRLATELERRGCEVLPSVTNFVAFRPSDAAALEAALLARGLVLRAYPSGSLQGWLRVTARDATETDRLLTALEEVLA